MPGEEAAAQAVFGGGAYRPRAPVQEVLQGHGQLQPHLLIDGIPLLGSVQLEMADQPINRDRNRGKTHACWKFEEMELNTAPFRWREQSDVAGGDRKTAADASRHSRPPSGLLPCHA